MAIEPTDPTLRMISAALDAVALRHQAIANNIANANTPGYVPLRVNFEQQLGAARAALAAGSPIKAADAMTEASAFIEPVVPPGSQAPAVSLDHEMVALASNTVRYEALARVLEKRMALHSAAINEGKR